MEKDGTWPSVEVDLFVVCLTTCMGCFRFPIQRLNGFKTAQLRANSLGSRAVQVNSDKAKSNLANPPSLPIWKRNYFDQLPYCTQLRCHCATRPNRATQYSQNRQDWRTCNLSGWSPANLQARLKVNCAAIAPRAQTAKQYSQSAANLQARAGLRALNTATRACRCAGSNSAASGEYTTLAQLSNF